jgi:uncharacterized protein YdhG (YjbR/CyaY superfamily)
MNIQVKSIEDYIALQPQHVQPLLEQMWEIISDAAPEAEEAISYGMPTFKYHGMLVGFAGAKKHIGFYPCSASTVDDLKDELKDFSTSKGTIRFEMDKPLPVKLIKKIVKMRMKQNLLKSKKEK